MLASSRPSYRAAAPAPQSPPCQSCCVWFDVLGDLTLDKAHLRHLPVEQQHRRAQPPQHVGSGIGRGHVPRKHQHAPATLGEVRVAGNNLLQEGGRWERVGAHSEVAMQEDLAICVGGVAGGAGSSAGTCDRFAAA